MRRVVFLCLLFCSFNIAMESTPSNKKKELEKRLKQLKSAIEEFEGSKCIFRLVKVFPSTLAGYLQKKYPDDPTLLTPEELNRLLAPENMQELRKEAEKAKKEELNSATNNPARTIARFEEFDDHYVQFTLKLSAKEFETVTYITKKQRKKIFDKTIVLLKRFFGEKWNEQQWPENILKDVCMNEHPMVIMEVVGDCYVLFSETSLYKYFGQFNDLHVSSIRQGEYKVSYDSSTGGQLDFYFDEEPYAYGTDNIAEILLCALQFHLNFIDFFEDTDTNEPAKKSKRKQRKTKKRKHTLFKYKKRLLTQEFV